MTLEEKFQELLKDGLGSQERDKAIKDAFFLGASTIIDILAEMKEDEDVATSQLMNAIDEVAKYAGNRIDEMEAPVEVPEKQ